jgi:hypothetical protein
LRVARRRFRGERGDALNQLVNTPCSHASKRFKKSPVAQMNERPDRWSVFGVFGAALIGALSSCVYVPPEPAPLYPYFEPVPLALPPPGPHRVCRRGWHWIGGHHTRSGRWVPGHCVRNWVRPPRSQREPRPYTPPDEPQAPPSAGGPSETPPPAPPVSPGR